MVACLGLSQAEESEGCSRAIWDSPLRVLKQAAQAGDMLGCLRKRLVPPGMGSGDQPVGMHAITVAATWALFHKNQ